MADSPGIGSSSSSSVNDDPEKKLLTKLSLWRVEPALSPITTHTELEPILANLGFYPGSDVPPHILHGAVWWKSYFYTGRAASKWMNKLKPEEEPPSVKLPYPHFDGHHEFTYTAFLRALNFYLELDDDDNLSSIFRIMSMNVDESELQESDWKLEESEENNYMYKPTILDSAAVESMINKLYGNGDAD